jgi:hypothetical protein
MEHNKILIVHPQIADIEQLKQSLNKDVKMYITTSIKNVSIYRYIKNIAFLYHKEVKFPFYFDSPDEIMNEQNYMSENVKSYLEKHVVKNNIIIDFLSCSLPNYAQKELLYWGNQNNISLRFSLDNTGVLPANWIMETGTYMSNPVDIKSVYFNSLIYRWKVILDSHRIFMYDPDGNLEKHFEVHHISKMIIQRSDVPSSDIFVDINNAYIHAYIQLDEGYILNGNGYCVDISEMKIYLEDNSTVPYNKWNGLIQCLSVSTQPNRKNIIKNIGVKGLFDYNQLSIGGGYIIRPNNNCFEIYDSYAHGRINSECGGIVGRLAGNENVDDKLPDNKENKIQNSIYIYSCYHKGIKEQWSGGIIGSNSGKHMDIVIQSCYSMGDIYMYAGGILGGVSSSIDRQDVSYNNKEHIVRYCYSTDIDDGNNLNIVGGGGIVGSVNVNNYKIKVENSYSTGDISFVSNENGHVIGGGIYSYVNNDNDISNNFENINTYTKDWDYNYIEIDTSNIRLGKHNLELIKTNSINIIDNNELINYDLNDGFKGYDMCGNYTTDMYPKLSSFTNKYNDYRQYYIFKKIDTNILQRGYSPWIYPVLNVENSYKIHRNENLNETGTGINKKMTIISESYKKHNDIPLYVNTEILHLGFYMDMMYQIYKDRDSSLNDISANIHEYPDNALRNDLSNNTYDLSDNKLSGFKDFVEKRYMMIRARDYLKHIKENKSQSRVKEEVNQIMKTRDNINKYDYKVMDVVIGDMTRIKYNKEIRDTEYYDNNSIKNSDLNVKLQHQNNFTRDIPNTLYTTVNSQYTAKDLFFLSNFIANFNKLTRVDLADDSIYGLSKTDNKVKDFAVLDEADSDNCIFKNNVGNDIKFTESLKEYAKNISEYFPSYYGYRNIYDTSNLEVYTDKGFYQKYINAFAGGNDDEDIKFRNMGKQSLWSIFELLHMKKYKKVLEQNLTRIVPPYKNVIDIRNQNVEFPPERFTSLEDMKNVSTENLNKIQRYLYSEFSNQYYPSHLFYDLSLSSI